MASAAAAVGELCPDGYREQFERSMANAERTADALVDRGFDVTPPELSLVASSGTDDLFSALCDRGWRVSRTASGDLRIVCMPHVTRETLSAFLRDVDDLR